MSKHFISRAAINATDALTQALFVWESMPKGKFDMEGIQELVDIINKASLHLASMARIVGQNREWLKEKAKND